MQTMKSSNRYLVTFFAGAALNGALLFVILPPFLDAFHLYNANNFPDGYNNLAKSLENGNGYKFFPNTGETILRTPVYPIVLSLLFNQFGESLLAAQIFNFALTIIIAWLTSILSGIISKNSKTLRTITPLIIFLHPGVIISETRGGVEITLMLGILTFIILLALAVKKCNMLLYFSSGIALGITALVKSTPLLFILLVFPYLLHKNWRKGFIRHAAIPVILIVFATLTFLSPWIYRNYKISGEIIPTMTVLGISITQGQYICDNLSISDGSAKLMKVSTEQITDLARSKNYTFSGSNSCCGPFFHRVEDEIEFSRSLTASAVSKYLNNPTLAAKCAVTNIASFWFLGNSYKSSLLNLFIQIPFIIISVIGFRNLSIKQSEATHLILLFILYYAAIHVPILAFARHSTPLIPLISTFTAYGIVVLFKRDP
jgi:hypothetical protein